MKIDQYIYKIKNVSKYIESLNNDPYVDTTQLVKSGVLEQVMFFKNDDNVHLWLLDSDDVKFNDDVTVTYPIKGDILLKILDNDTIQPDEWYCYEGIL